MGNCCSSPEEEFVKALSTPGNALPGPAESPGVVKTQNSISTGPGRSSNGSMAMLGRLSTSSSVPCRSSSASSLAPGPLSMGRDNGHNSNPEGQILEVPNLRIFTYAELKAATKNFKPETMLGEGGFGKVYKGHIEEKPLNTGKSGSGTVVAVKRLNPESVQGLQEWQSEVNFLGRLSHPNLVRLLGYCVEDRELLLVYEYMPKGSLESHLFKKGGAIQPLTWGIRLRIAIGAARGLAFLHSSEKQVIYRDFKASNILLDNNFNSKLSDFGLAKNGPTGGNSHVTTRVMGTYGYAAPEYVATGHLYIKSDVYGFGVVLLEILTGLRALDTSRPSGQQNLVDWAKPYLSDRRRLARLMDPRLEGQYPSRGAFQAAQLTLNCLAGDPKSRPSMNEVVSVLEEIESFKSRSRESTDSLPQSAGRNRGLVPEQRDAMHPRMDGNRSPREPDGFTAGSRNDHRSPGAR